MPLLEFLKSLRRISPSEIARLSESQARKRILEPMLRQLGWNTDTWDGEVVEEYKLENRKIDYCLRVGNLNRVFIEAKKPIVNLDGHHRQLIDYSFTGGAKIAILTNCIKWLFFLPLSEGPWQGRMFYQCDIFSNELDVLVDSFNAFLSRERVVSGQAASEAERYLQERQRDTFVSHCFPEVWKKLIFSKDERFVRFFSEIIEQDYGKRPQRSDVEEFLGVKKGLYEKVEEKEEKKRLKSLSSPGQKQRQQPASESREINTKFNKAILGELFGEEFSLVGRYTTMYESKDHLVFFRNYSTPDNNLWYRVEAKPWRILKEDARNTLLIFTNAASNKAYVVPIKDVIYQVKVSGYNKEHLEVNIDSASDKWIGLGWNIRKYLKDFCRI